MKHYTAIDIGGYLNIKHGLINEAETWWKHMKVNGGPQRWSGNYAKVGRIVAAYLEKTSADLHFFCWHGGSGEVRNFLCWAADS